MAHPEKYFREGAHKIMFCSLITTQVPNPKYFFQLIRTRGQYCPIVLVLAHTYGTSCMTNVVELFLIKPCSLGMLISNWFFLFILVEQFSSLLTEKRTVLRTVIRILTLNLF